MAAGSAEMRLNGWTWRNGQRHDVLQFVKLPPRSEWPVGSQGVLVPAILGKATSSRKKVWRGRSL